MERLMEKVHKTAAYHIKKQQKWIRKKMLLIVKPSLKRPIFVVGCSRAGTTLVYKTLSESDELGSLQKETHDFWAALHPISERAWSSHAIPAEMASEEDREKIGRFFYTETGKERVVDKNNQNGLSIPYLHKLYPDAHFVFIKRNPGDNINSLIVGWGKENEFGGWSETLPEQVNVSDGQYKCWCFFLAEGWRDFLNRPIEEVCAFQYRMINQAILDAKPLIPTSQWHEIGYEELIANPVNEFERIFKGCGIPFDKKIRKHCGEVLQKPYNTFSKIEVDKWKSSKNSERIDAVLPSLADLKKSLGYR